MFRVSVSLLTVCVHGEGEVGVGLANILQLFYGQVSELILGRERKKIRKKVSLQRLLYERQGKGYYRRQKHKMKKVIITFSIINSFDVK